MRIGRVTGDDLASPPGQGSVLTWAPWFLPASWLPACPAVPLCCEKFLSVKAAVFAGGRSGLRAGMRPPAGPTLSRAPSQPSRTRERGSPRTLPQHVAVGAGCTDSKLIISDNQTGVCLPGSAVSLVEQGEDVLGHTAGFANHEHGQLFCDARWKGATVARALEIAQCVHLFRDTPG